MGNDHFPWCTGSTGIRLAEKKYTGISEYERWVCIQCGATIEIIEKRPYYLKDDEDDYNGEGTA